jgi:site-specific DNA recombinase
VQNRLTAGQAKRVKSATKATGAVLLLRVSTQRQKDSGIGIELQEATCRDYCARMGIPVLSVHTDAGVSGKDALSKRPGLQAAIAAVQGAPGSVMVAYSLSRLGRSQKLIWTLLDDRGEYALPFVSATEPFDTSTPMGRAMLGMLAVWAQLEADLASERSIDALAAVAERGTKLGAPNMVETTDEETGERVKDPAKVALVGQVKRLYATGEYSHRSLAEHLNATGVPSVTGARWHARTVRVAIGVELG